MYRVIRKSTASNVFEKRKRGKEKQENEAKRCWPETQLIKYEVRRGAKRGTWDGVDWTASAARAAGRIGFWSWR